MAKELNSLEALLEQSYSAALSYELKQNSQRRCLLYS